MRWAEFTALQSPRLHLRKMRRDDLEHYFRLAGSEAVTRYMLFQPHKSMEESKASMEKWLSRYEAGNCYHWVIGLKETDELIGIIDLLRFDETADSCSFAYMLGEEFWGRGYGTEALKAVLEFGFREMELACIEADHMEANAASGAVMRKCGMKCQGILSGKYEKNGAIHNAVLYRINRDAWMQ